MRAAGGETHAGRGGHFAHRAFCALLALLFTSLFSSLFTSGASAQPSPRAAQHDGYARIVFDWDAPVEYSAEIINGALLVRFDRPIKGDLLNLTKPLAKLVKGVSMSGDGKTASLLLTRPVTIKSLVDAKNSVVIDLYDEAPAAGVDAPPQAPPQAAAIPLVDVRAGDHGSYVRLVFDWPAQVGYAVDKQGTRAGIAFAKPAKMDQAALQSGLPADISIVNIDNGAKGLGIVLQVPTTARLRHFTSGNKVVVDVVRAADAAAPADSAKVPLAPAETDVAMPALKPLRPSEQPKTPQESLRSGPSPVKRIPEPKGSEPRGPDTKSKEKPAIAEAAPQPAATPVAAPTPPATPAPTPPAKVFSLSLAMTKPAAVAVFERAGYLWIVLDRRQEIDTALLRRLGGEAVLAAEQLPNKDATVVRLVVQPDYYPSMRKEGLLWVVDLTQQFSKPKDLIPIQAPANLPNGIGMNIKAPDSGSLISVTDPEIGDVIKVVPVIPLGQGVYPGRDSPDVEVLPTAQGIAIVAHVDGLDIRSTRGGVTIGTISGAGLRFSSELDTAPREGAKPEGTGLYDIQFWKRGGPDNFAANRKIINTSLKSVSASKRAMANMQASRFYFANGFGAEALGYMHLAALDQPDLADQPAFKALKGGAELLMAQYDLAAADLDDPSLQGDVEVQMWRGATHAELEAQPAAWDKPLAAGLKISKDYPHRLRWLMATNAVKAAVSAGDAAAADSALNLLDRDEASKMETPERDYLHATFDQMAGRYDKAIDEYDNAADGASREYRALAKYAETELALHTRKITPKEAADQLDKLRFSWREESFEFNLLLRYAELQQEAGDYPSALRALRSLVNYYPDDKETPRAQQMMNDIFDRLYMQGQADQLSPVSAIALFDEFKDLTPTGAKGDEMIRKLADRLAKVDLLDRAGELLKHQVNNRLQGLDKARVGAQLALVELMNQQPQGAIDGLAASEVPGLPAELVRQRRELRARALSDLGKPADAIAALDGDTSQDAAQLRAEIHFKAQDWPAAAADYEALIPRPERGAKLDDMQARNCLNWATALVLANDERALQALRRNFLPSIVGTPYQDGFNLLTSALDRDTPNLPEVISKIKEVEGFKNFLSDYRKRMQTAGLSAIN
jgi:tetratricopeptide (TPR) repeat protein